MDKINKSGIFFITNFQYVSKFPKSYFCSKLLFHDFIKMLMYNKI